MNNMDNEVDEVIGSSRRTNKNPVGSMEMRVKMRDDMGNIRSMKNVVDP